MPGAYHPLSRQHFPSHRAVCAERACLQGFLPVRGAKIATGSRNAQPTRAHAAAGHKAVETCPSSRRPRGRFHASSLLNSPLNAWSRLLSRRVARGRQRPGYPAAASAHRRNGHVVCAAARARRPTVNGGDALTAPLTPPLTPPQANVVALPRRFPEWDGGTPKTPYWCCLPLKTRPVTRRGRSTRRLSP